MTTKHRSATPCALRGCVAHEVKGGTLCAVHARRLGDRCEDCKGSGTRRGWASAVARICTTCGGTGLTDAKENAV